MTDVCGISWPLRFTGGRLAVSSGEDHLRENLAQVIGTAKGEYLGRPDFGCDLHSRVFDPVNTGALMDGDIKEAAAQFEPRLEITEVTSEAAR